MGNTPAQPAVTVELVPTARRTGPLAGVEFAVTQRNPDNTMDIHLPDTAVEKALHPAEYAAAVARVVGGTFVSPKLAFHWDGAGWQLSDLEPVDARDGLVPNTSLGSRPVLLVRR